MELTLNKTIFHLLNNNNGEKVDVVLTIEGSKQMDYS